MSSPCRRPASSVTPPVPRTRRPVAGDSRARRPFWSAGCSNGQEPYSLAMVLHESGITDWEVIASDVSTDAMARTQRPLLPRRDGRCQSGAPERHFAQVGDDWEVLPSLSRRVELVRHSLRGATAVPTGRCQIVFCRNVLIYVRPEDVLASLSGWPDGCRRAGGSSSVTPNRFGRSPTGSSSYASATLSCTTSAIAPPSRSARR